MREFDGEMMFNGLNWIHVLFCLALIMI